MGEEVRELVSGILGVRREGLSSNYLGLSSLIGRNKREILGFVKNKIIKRVQSWGHKIDVNQSRERDSFKKCSPSYSHLSYECLFYPKRSVERSGGSSEWILVGW